MKQGFWFLCASIVSLLLGGSLASVSAQTTTPTPDPFVVQLTSTPSAAFNTSIGDMTANGRFVVFVSNGDVSTEKTIDGRNNADGNREVALGVVGAERGVACEPCLASTLEQRAGAGVGERGTCELRRHRLAARGRLCA